MTKNKKILYSIALTVFVSAFLFTNYHSALVEAEVAQGAYYRGEYLFTTYYPSPFGSYAQLQAGDPNDYTGKLILNQYETLYGKETTTDRDRIYTWAPDAVAVGMELVQPVAPMGLYYFSDYFDYDPSHLGQDKNTVGIAAYIRAKSNAGTETGSGKQINGASILLVQDKSTTKANAVGFSTSIFTKGSAKGAAYRVVGEGDGSIEHDLYGLYALIQPQSNLDKVYGAQLILGPLTVIPPLITIDDPQKLMTCLYLDNQIVGTDANHNKWALYSNKGNNYFADSVGIGTTNPQKKLDVRVDEAGVYKPVDILSSGGRVLRVANENNEYAHIEFLTRDSSFSTIGSYYDGSRPGIVFGTGSTSGGVTERVRIDKDGNVGIGTTNPASKLAVVGLPVYADNSAATTAGELTVGAFYRTSDGTVKVVY